VLFLEVPGTALAPLLRDLRFSNSEAAWIGELVRRWQSLGDEIDHALRSGQPDPRTVRQWAARAGRTRLPSLFRIAAAVWAARAEAGLPAPDPARTRAAYRLLLRIAYRDPIEISDLAVDGEDLAGAGIAAGPQVGKILRALLAIVLADPARNTRSELLIQAAEMATTSDHPKTTD
jgi:tRNA nucleotidyltransferase (CCA-adding enzyme)